MVFFEIDKMTSLHLKACSSYNGFIGMSELLCMLHVMLVGLKSIIIDVFNNIIKQLLTAVWILRDDDKLLMLVCTIFY